MKKIATAAVAALVALAPLSGVAQAQGKTAPVQQQQSAKQQAQKQQWKKGGKYNGRGTTLSNYSRYKLKAPPKGHRWVRDGNDFLLVATATGVIASIVAGAVK